MENWEDVATGLKRTRVPGGWLYCYATTWGVSLCFIPQAGAGG